MKGDIKTKLIYDKEEFVLKRAIFYIKKGWGANCKDFAEQCESCHAKDVIKFLEKSIKYAKENK